MSTPSESQHLAGLRAAAPGFYPPDEAARAEMFMAGMVAVDTNVLLSLYRYTPDARHEFMTVLGLLGDRLFVPHQVAAEYERNRIGVVGEQGKFFQEVVAQIEAAQKKADNQVAAVLPRCGKHHAARVKIAQETMQRAMAALGEAVKEVRSSQDVTLPGALQRDPVRTQLERLCQDRVGVAPTPSELAGLTAEAKTRFESRIPPGFEDGRKTGNAEGDYLVWSQILAEAARRKLPVILVTDDGKADWVRREANLIVGPHPDLIVEMQERAGVDFALVTSEEFLVEAGKALASAVSDETLAEARAAVRDEAEQEQHDLDFYTSLLRNPEIMGIKSGRGGTFSRLALQQMLGEEAEELDPYRIQGGTVPKAVLAHYLRRRALRLELDRTLEELVALDSPGDGSPDPEERQASMERLFEKSDGLESDLATLDRRLQGLRHNAMKARRSAEPSAPES